MAIIAISFQATASFNLYTGGNSWSLGDGSIDSTNFTFTSLPTKFATYFYTNSSDKSFNLSIFMDSSVPVTVKVTIGSVTKTVSIGGNKNFAPVKVGSFLASSGYNQIITEITGASTGSGAVFNFGITGNLADLAYVPNNSGNNFYWGRRGSSANISPDTNGAINIKYFYSEIYVPIGYDPVGSYYMANGFG